MEKVRFSLAVLSLLLCVAAVGLWIRSYWVYDAFGRYYSKTDWRQVGGYREETRLVMQSWGLESVSGKIGIGTERWEMIKTSPATFAVQWEPQPDRDRICHLQVDSRARRGGQPLCFEPRQFSGCVGFGAVNAQAGSFPTARAVVIPHWFVAICMGIYPIIFLRGWLRRLRRRGRRQCVSCGYDLRATPQRCPECGASAKKAMEVAS